MEESVQYDQVLEVVVLLKGVLNQGAARKLDNARFILEESQPDEEEEEDWGRFPLEKEFAEEEINVDVDVAARSWMQASSYAGASSSMWSPAHSFNVQRRTWAFVYGQTASLLEKLILGSRAVPMVEGVENNFTCPAGSRPVMFESHSAIQKYLTWNSWSS